MNSITNNYARILCRLQYTFYRASFLIVIRIHRGINTTNRSYWSKQQTLAATGATGTTATKPPPKRQPPESIERQPLESIISPGATATQPPESIERQPPSHRSRSNDTHWSHWNNSHWSHWNDSHWSRSTALEPLQRQSPYPSNNSHRSRSNDSHSRSCKRQPLESIERATAKFWSCKQQILAPTTQEQQILEPTRVRYRNCWSCE